MKKNCDPQDLLIDLNQWAALHHTDFDVALWQAVRIFLEVQGAAGYAEIHEI